MDLEVLDFLNENELRAFPLAVTGASQNLPDGYIVDLRLVYTTEAIPSTVCLTSISLNDTLFTFTFTNTVTPSSVVITAPASPSSSPYVYARNSYGSLIVVSKALYDFYWNQTPRNPVAWTFSGLSVEPSRVSEIRNAWNGVSSLTFSPAYQSDPTMELKPILPLVPAASTSLTGNITLSGGYNTELRLTGDALSVYVGGGYGEPVGCSDEFIASNLKDCSNIISYINGAGPSVDGSINFNAQTNVVVFPGSSLASGVSGIIPDCVDARPYMTFVGLSFISTDVCSPVTIYPGGPR